MVQPPIPTSIPSTADSAYEPDSAVATGPAEVPPGRLGPGGGPGERSRRPAAVRVAVRVAGHPREGRAAAAADEQLDPVAGRPDTLLLHPAA